jgi:hypothetical protein
MVDLIGEVGGAWPFNGSAQKSLLRAACFQQPSNRA